MGLGGRSKVRQNATKHFGRRVERAARLRVKTALISGFYQSTPSTIKTEF